MLVYVRRDVMNNNVETFYNTYLLLDDIKRTGWVISNIPEQDISTVADHTLQVVMLASTLCHELDLNYDIGKMLQMCFIHDIGEIVIGDVAIVDENYEEKKMHEERAVAKMLEPLSEKTRNYYLDLWKELNARETELARFVHQIDKLDAVMRSKKYAEVYNRPELFDEFYNNQVEAKTFEGSVLETFFTKLKD